MFPLLIISYPFSVYGLIIFTDIVNKFTMFYSSCLSPLTVQSDRCMALRFLWHTLWVWPLVFWKHPVVEASGIL